METLADRIARDGPVSELDAIGWAIRLARRLEALHALGVAHGSVSPACVIAAGGDRNARAVLVDVQKTPALLAFQSPERILGGTLSPSDDVWALAATLYALLTGQNPFAGTSEAELRQKILAASPAPLAVFDVGDDDLQAIVDRAFARELRGRTSSVSALRRSLEEWHPDRGVANLPPLEDEEASTDDDDGMRTMMVRDAGAYAPSHDPTHAAHAAQAAHAALAPQPSPAWSSARPGDDDDDARTVMRVMPQEEMRALLGARRGPAPAAPAPAAPAPVAAPPPAPRPYAPGPPNAPFVPRPAEAPRSRATGTLAMQAMQGPPVAPLAPHAPAPPVAPQRPAHTIDDDPSEDLMTVMRTPEQLMADAADPRLRPDQPSPFGQQRPHVPPFDPPQAFMARVAATQKMDQVADPQPTLAMPENLAPQPYPPIGAGTMPMPAGMGTFPMPQPAPQPAPPPAPAALAPVEQPPPPAPLVQEASAAEGGIGTVKLAILALVALVVAAAATFLALKLKGL